jgi:hypothetical protein
MEKERKKERKVEKEKGGKERCWDSARFATTHGP